MKTYIYKFSHQVNEQESDLVGAVYQLVIDTGFDNRRAAKEVLAELGQLSGCVFFEFEGEAPASFLIEN